MDRSTLAELLQMAVGRASAEARRSGLVRLNEPEVLDLCRHLGLAAADHAYLPAGADPRTRAAWAEAATALAAGCGRVLLKIVGRDILHKTESGGVQVVETGGEGGITDLLAAGDRLLAKVGERLGPEACEGVLAAAFVPHRPNQPGQELLLALRRDPAFGPCVVVGVGGTLTEWYGRGCRGASTLIFPAADLQAGTVASALLAHPLLQILCSPSRLYEQPPLTPETIAEAVLQLAGLGVASGPGCGAWTLREIEINPAVAGVGRLVALDGVGLVSADVPRAPARPTAKIHPLLRPRSAVVLGVSAQGANPGRIILDNLKRSAGLDPARLYVVHGREKVISGVPCFADVASLPEKCDLAVVAVPAQGALEAIAQLVEHDRAQSIILIPGGFAEAGQDRLARDIEDILAASHARPGAGPVMVGGNCLGIVSRDQYNTFFLPDYKLPFRPGHGRNLAVISQSGAYLVTFASNYDGLILPQASISFGNQMDLTVADFLEHFLQEEAVRVIACYVEGFRPEDGERFCRLVRRARRQGKRVIAFKAGKTPLGAKAAASHTASLAGDYAVAKSCLTQAGADVAESLTEFEDWIMAFSLLADRPAPGTRVGIISNAGFECSTVMDRLGGLRLAEFDAGTRDVLDKVLPAFAHRANPIDCTPMTGTEAFAASCRAILDCPTVDAAILSAVPVTPSLDTLPADPQGRHAENLAAPGSLPGRLIEIMRGSPKPAVVVVDSGGIYDPMCRLILEAGIPVFRKIDRAVRALAAFCAGQGVQA